ncbi:hypothetical protein L6R50_07910 [Myxococcota bacterium]|nr:hypothetical protein [Myxococcota bacterium]
MRTARTRASLVVLVAAAGCSDYDLAGPGEFVPAEQPDALEAETVTETFLQRVAAASDILFVVDNSGSMEEEQEALAQNFWNFIQFFADSTLDYHIGVVTNDEYFGQWPIGQLHGDVRYIDPTTPDPVGTFTANANVGDEGWGECEMGLEAVRRAVTTPLVDGYNAGFYRESALLSVIVVSDEHDFGGTGTCSGIHYSEFIPFFLDLKGPEGRDLLHFSAIVGDIPGGCTSDWGSADPGTEYHAVVDGVGGSAYSICEHDWEGVLTELGLESAGLRRSFNLSLVPIPESIVVTLDEVPDDDAPAHTLELCTGQTETCDWKYDPVSNSIEFPDLQRIPPEGGRLQVTYKTQESA